MVQYKKVVRTIIALLFLSVSLNTSAQTTTSSPYSKFGLGELRGDQLPQLRGMGGISTGVRSFDSFFNINVGNPASYSGLRLTTLDAGLYGTYGSMSRDGVSQTNANFNLSHLNFAIPVSGKSALSFGLMPYSSVGYRFSSPNTIDTININNVYSGDGDISKAYFGYGIQFGKHVSLGFNANYLFGKLRNTQEAQYPPALGALNSKVERTRLINGLNLDYGIQYSTYFGDDLNMVIGYAGNVSSNMRLKESEAVYRTFGSSIGDTENVPLDSIKFSQGQPKDLTMPLTHKVGISFSKANSWLIGADAHVSNWSDYREGDFNPGLQDSYGFALGGQYTPDITSTKYLNLVNYRLGINYNKSNIKINNKDVNEMGISVGLGLPLPSNRRNTFYKINFSAEFIQRGSSDIHLVKENFVNFHLGFTLNDRWFQRYKYD
jgi:hypothetical protein